MKLIQAAIGVNVVSISLPLKDIRGKYTGFLMNLSQIDDLYEWGSSNRYVANFIKIF